jgi:hypothetical protein
LVNDLFFMNLGSRCFKIVLTHITMSTMMLDATSKPQIIAITRYALLYSILQLSRNMTSLTSV